MFSRENTLNSEEWPNLEKYSECYGPSFSSSNFNLIFLKNRLKRSFGSGLLGEVLSGLAAFTVSHALAFLDQFAEQRFRLSSEELAHLGENKAV